jgi:hypothetical protein
MSTGDVGICLDFSFADGSTAPDTRLVKGS